MVNKDSLVDDAFAALADPTRRQILAVVADEDGITVGRLAAPLADRMSAPAVSKHLRVLERAGLLTQTRVGRTRRCHLSPAPLAAADAWLATYRKFWTQKLDQLGDHLEREDTPAPPSEEPRR